MRPCPRHPEPAIPVKPHARDHPYIRKQPNLRNPRRTGDLIRDRQQSPPKPASLRTRPHRNTINQHMVRPRFQHQHTGNHPGLNRHINIAAGDPRPIILIPRLGHIAGGRQVSRLVGRRLDRLHRRRIRQPRQPHPIAHHSIFRYIPVRVTSPHRDAFLL